MVLLAAAVALLACSQSNPSVPIIQATPKPPAPALVQVENSPDARPHSGLQKADFIYEYLTEGGISRFTVVFMNPSGSDPIGPVRSARLVSLKLQKAYGGPIFFSGASDHVLGLVVSNNVTAFDETSGSAYYTRDSSRQAPHNLYTTGDKLAQGVKKSGKTLDFTPAPRGEPTGTGDAVTKLSFAQTQVHSVAYAYDASSKTYTYTSETGPEVDAQSKQPYQITNVVLIRVAHHDAGYTEDVLGENGIDFDLQGTGTADVYTRGKHFAAKWDLSDPTKPPRILDQSGKDFPLPQGLTWIHLVDPDLAVTAG